MNLIILLQLTLLVSFSSTRPQNEQKGLSEIISDDSPLEPTTESLESTSETSSTTSNEVRNDFTDVTSESEPPSTKSPELTHRNEVPFWHSNNYDTIQPRDNLLDLASPESTFELPRYTHDNTYPDVVNQVSSVNYFIRYKIPNGAHREEKGWYRPDGVWTVQGAYSWQDIAGRSHLVNFIADDQGYRADTKSLR